MTSFAARFCRLALLGLLLHACASIPNAPIETTREELEVAVAIDPTVATMLNAGVEHQLEALVMDSILSIADVGLRFYPVPTTSYSESDERPDYRLTVTVKALHAELDQRVVHDASELPSLSRSLNRLECTASARFEKRRAVGPMLSFADADGHGATKIREAGGVLTSEPKFALEAGLSGPALVFDSGDLGEAVRAAVTSALRQIVEHIDRELPSTVAQLR